MPTPLQGDLGPEFLGPMMGVELLLAKFWALSRSAMSVVVVVSCKKQQTATAATLATARLLYCFLLL